MEGKSSSTGNHLMGDVVVSPAPSPLQQQNFGGSLSPSSTTVTRSGVKMPTITFESVVSQKIDVQPEESEEDVQEFVGGSGRKKQGFRKRKKSIHGGGNDVSYLPPYKQQRRLYLRRHVSCSGINFNTSGLNKSALRFLLGGNAHDPLNLNGLGESDNAVTPKTSPMPVPTTTSGQIPIMIPKNYQDPLRLMSEDEIENTRDVIEGILPPQPPHRRRRHRKRSLRKRNDSECSIESSKIEVDDVGKEATDVVAQLRAILPDPTSAEEVTLKKAAVAESTGSLEKVKTQVNINITSGEERTLKDEDPATSAVTAVIVAPEEKEVAPTPYPFRVSSDYIPLSSHYQPSPFVMDTMNENFTVLPFESPSMSNYMGTQDTYTITEPFSPPPPPRLTDVIIEHRVPSGHYGLGVTPPRNEIQQRRQLPPQPSVQQQAMFNRRHRHRLDPIVSPVVPNFGTGKRSWMPHVYNHSQGRHHKKQETKMEEKADTGRSEQNRKPEQKYRPKDKIFRYGNYNQYYGYRNAGHAEDARLRAFNKEWIQGKDVLDIGCNVGHVTLCLGRDFEPRRIIGIDIDGILIKVAAKNIKHYVDRDPSDVSITFPLALSVVHGSLQPPQLEATVGRTPEYGPNATPSSISGCQGECKRIPFPYNVGFRQENYVLDSDDLLTTVKPQYDVVICLSTTKWVHLNFGDEGLKRFFRRAFLNLRAGGIFVLEPQPWSSYKKKKKLTEEIFKTFQTIKFFPKDFETFLLKEVGYSSVKLVGIPAHHSKGFQRPIYVFTKDTAKHSCSNVSATVTTATDEASSSSSTTEKIAP